MSDIISRLMECKSRSGIKHRMNVYDEAADRIRELEAQVTEIPTLLRKERRKHDALVEGINQLLKDDQQTPMAPPGFRHVWSDDLRDLLEKDDE